MLSERLHESLSAGEGLDQEHISQTLWNASATGLQYPPDLRSGQLWTPTACTALKLPAQFDLPA